MAVPYYYTFSAESRLPKSEAEKRLLEVLREETARKEVEEFVKRWNGPLRDRIRATTALKLTEEAGKSNVNIPVEVADGMPKPLSDRLGDLHEWQWWLLLHVQQLRDAAEGLNLVNLYKDKLKDANDGIGIPSEAIVTSHEHITKLLEQSNRINVLKRFKEIQEDVLGAYWTKSSKIQIYWMPIAVFAPILGVTVSSLTVTTLCHELVHAYTHRGVDIDGQSWPTEKFINADSHVTEGIAQFYTEFIMKDLGRRLLDGSKAFDETKKHQSSPYTAYKDWLGGGKKLTPEAARLAMLRARRRAEAKISHDEFKGEIMSAHEQISGERGGG